MPPETIREARLKPEFASLYPWMRPDIWYVAASVMSAARDCTPEPPDTQRLLSEEHFEFRGGNRRLLDGGADRPGE
jgi:hypothetical protein